LAPAGVVRGEGERGAAQPVRRAHGARRREGEEGRVTVVAQQNPLLEGLQVRPRPEPGVLVIFGASGDLTQRKLMPALYSLAYRRLLPEKFAVLGVARSQEGDGEFRSRMEQAVKDHARDPFRDDIWQKLADGMRYVAIDF